MDDKKEKICYRGRKGKRIGMLLSVLLLSGLFGCGKKDTYTVSSEEHKTSEVCQEAEDDNIVQAGESCKERIYVHVCGAVKYPGVYEFSGDTRVFQAVESAGGLLPEAYEAALNQAQAVKDGERIYVPTTEEWERGTEDALEEKETDDGLVNINTADEAKLCTLPGVGKTRAKAIVEYRVEHGSFEKIEDIQNVSGIKSGLFNKIKDYIRTE